MKKLKKILLINWLYFSKEIIEIGDVNFLTGKNGAGKSTVIDALQIVLLGETNARNFNLAANERSQRTLDGYLRADIDENNPYSRRGKDFSTYIVCEFEDDMEHNSFVCGVMFDCRSDGSKHDHFFIYVGKLPENCFVEDGEAMDIHDLRKFLKQNFSRAEVYDTQWEYRRNMLSRWNVHNEQVLRMMKKAVSFRPIVDIQQFITENICDIPDKPDIEAMQQNIRNYKRHEQLAQQQEEKLTALQEISTLYREMTRSVDRWRVQSFLVQWAQKEDMQAQIDSREQEKRNCLSELTAADTAIEDLAGQVQAKEERRRQLELIGFEWNQLDSKWMKEYRALKVFFDTCGRWPKREDGPLATWCYTQRERRKNGRLSKERIRALDEIGFVWNQDLQREWMKNYEELKSFVGKYQRFPKSTEGNLGGWCHTQRKMHKLGKLSHDRWLLLDKIGFVWSAEQVWQGNFEQLRLFHNRQGRWPGCREGALGRWCTIQRRDYRKGNMSDERIVQLERIGFPLS